MQTKDTEYKSYKNNKSNDTFNHMTIIHKRIKAQLIYRF